MPKPVATWNPARGVWETERVALCGHSEPYSATWPTSGMTRSGSAFELPTLVPLMDGSASSSSPGLLSTPQSRDWKGVPGDGFNTANLARDVSLLPTPSVADSMGGHLTRSGDRSGELLLPGVVKTLLPTPTAMDSKASGGSSPSDVTLTDAVVRTSLGATTNPRFDGGNTSSDD